MPDILVSEAVRGAAMDDLIRKFERRDRTGTVRERPSETA